MSSLLCISYDNISVDIADRLTLVELKNLYSTCRYLIDRWRGDGNLWRNRCVRDIGILPTGPSYRERYIGYGWHIQRYRDFHKGVFDRFVPLPRWLNVISTSSIGGDPVMVVDRNGIVYKIYDGEEQAPWMVPFDKKIVELGANACHTCMLDRDGDVWMMNIYNEIMSVESESKIASLCSLDYALDINGKPFEFDGDYANTDCESDSDEPCRYVPMSIHHVKTMSVGGNAETTIFYIDKIGSVWVYGDNYHGQLGLGDKVDRDSPVRLELDTDIIDVSCGYDHSSILDADGNVWITGGYPCTDRFVKIFTDNAIKIISGFCRTLILDSKGRVWLSNRTGTGRIGGVLATDIRCADGRLMFRGWS